MVVIVARCKQCGSSKHIPLSLTFTYEWKSCQSCMQSTSRQWHYSFCDAHCMVEWMMCNVVAEEGFPCEDCRMTGFDNGFKSNGVCKTCDGKKRVKP